jgi:hypothetical protein
MTSTDTGCQEDNDKNTKIRRDNAEQEPSYLDLVKTGKGRSQLQVQDMRKRVSKRGNCVYTMEHCEHVI